MDRLSPTQEALFPVAHAEPADTAPAKPRKLGRPRHDDDAPEREMAFMVSLEQRRFIDRECRRLGLTRSEYFSRIVGLFQDYQQPKIPSRR